MKVMKTQFLLLGFILKTRLDDVYPNVFITFQIRLAKLPRYCCQRWKEFQQTEADQNLQQVSYDRKQIVLISHVVNRSFMCVLSRLG